ncbi:MAG: bifunctional demethylmenaquinone methyltransferase/2-methoxy-6-polyprenyl-1,4-benzoquinol methylase UbiE [Phycisphaeraceae bacterium]|nr:bifunctional demethylmenaquinone methyltransferase/2-methoxy-6-polyprenyl-1,4-benzoquinol methylase UbiE [Phycisphaeraceae bacterium]
MTPPGLRHAPAESDAAWTPDDLAADPHRDPEKAQRVQRMFAAIAARYDLNNRLHSFGMDQGWRRRAVRAAAPLEGARVLDVACGTGDLSLAMAAGGAAEVVGVDFTEPMLDIARQKSTARTSGTSPRFQWGDAMALDFPDASFNRVSIAFGLRNVSDPSRALREFQRVLKPGGRLIILEFDEPRVPIIRQLSRFYTRVIMPWTATLIARDRSGAYRYLPRSVETFLDRNALAELLRKLGFQAIRQQSLSMGIAVVTTAEVPAPRAPGP